jgi:hypothetical protein
MAMARQVKCSGSEVIVHAGAWSASRIKTLLQCPAMTPQRGYHAIQGSRNCRFIALSWH